MQLIQGSRSSFECENSLSHHSRHKYKRNALMNLSGKRDKISVRRKIQEIRNEKREIRRRRRRRNETANGEYDMKTEVQRTRARASERANQPLSASRGTWPPVQDENDTGYKRRIRKFRGAMKNATAELSST